MKLPKFDVSAGRFRLSTFSILLFLFLASVAIRVPNIGRPLSENYEWVTAHTLLTNRIWQEDGIVGHRFNPVYTYANPNDRNIPADTGIANPEGRYYYISFPPFAFIFPYIVFTALGVDAGVLPLQILNIVLHFFCACMIYGIISRLYRPDRRRLFFPALLGFCIYVFNPANMWYHSNVYFSDTLVQIFFIATAFFFLLFIEYPGTPSRWTLPAIGLALFLATYTEWIGVFLGFTVFLYAAWHFRTHKRHRWLLCTAAGATGLAVLLIIGQYASINGLSAFVEGILGRYTERSGHSGAAYFYTAEGHLFLIKNYLRNFFPTLLILASSLFLLLTFKTDKIPFSHAEKALFFVTLIPVMLHHAVFFLFTIQHDFALLKSSVFLALIVAAIYVRAERHIENVDLPFLRRVVRGFILGLVALSIHFYYSHTISDHIDQGKRIGETIAAYARPDEAVFVVSASRVGNLIFIQESPSYTAPQLQFYAGRNIKVCSNMDQVFEHMQSYDKSRGIVFTMNKGIVDGFKRVRLENGEDSASPGRVYETRNLSLEDH